MRATTDHEPPIMDLVERVGRLRAAMVALLVILETSLAYASASSGMVERGVQAARGRVRVCCAARLRPRSGWRLM